MIIDVFIFVNFLQKYYRIFIHVWSIYFYCLGLFALLLNASRSKYISVVIGDKNLTIALLAPSATLPPNGDEDAHNFTFLLIRRVFKAWFRDAVVHFVKTFVSTFPVQNIT